MGGFNSNFGAFIVEMGEVGQDNKVSRSVPTIGFVDQ